MKPLSKLEEPLTLELGAQKAADGKGFLHISITPPVLGERKPCAFVCMLDVSGSMAESGSFEKDGEKDNFSRLDLVKHSVRTLIYTLGPEDYLCLIPFSTNAVVATPLSKMDEEGKKLALASVDKMFPDENTNIWGALKSAIDVVSSSPVCKSISTSLWLFTDGEPNVNPPKGIISALTGYMAEKKPLCSINTFGFGYRLDSKMLYDISVIGKGISCYIPDCNLVGTTFVNCLCNSLSTAADNVTLELRGSNVDNLTCVGAEMKKNVIEVGPVHFGQSRDFIIEFETTKPEDFSFAVKLTTKEKETVAELKGYTSANPLKDFSEYGRCKFCQLAQEGLDNFIAGKGDPAFLVGIANLIKSLPSKDEESMKALLRDVVSVNDQEGRVSKAFSTPERLKRWGYHFVRSIIRAHQVQECHNFKDPGVQVYGGKLFKDLQLKADITFCTIPAPTPSRKSEPKAVGPAVPPPPPDPVAPVMQEYYNSGGGCFDGEGLVSMADGTKKKVRDLKKGDIIASSKGMLSKIVCLVVFPINKEIRMVTINNLSITPKHPIMMGGKWVYPKDVMASKNVYCESIYNIVLDKHHTATINEVELVTLGHNKHDNSTIEHDYYGSSKVIDDLSRISGWSKGHVCLKKVEKIKDPFTGALVRIISSD